jgi:hypothetical protein
MLRTPMFSPEIVIGAQRYIFLINYAYMAYFIFLQIVETRFIASLRNVTGNTPIPNVGLFGKKFVVVPIGGIVYNVF